MIELLIESFCPKSGFKEEKLHSYDLNSMYSSSKILDDDMISLVKQTAGDFIRRLGYLEEAKREYTHFMKTRSPFEVCMESRIRCYKEDPDICMSPNFGICSFKTTKIINGREVKVKVYNRTIDVINEHAICSMSIFEESGFTETNSKSLPVEVINDPKFEGYISKPNRISTVSRFSFV